MDPMEDPEDVLRANRSREKQFVFDCTFDGGASQVHPKYSQTFSSPTRWDSLKTLRYSRYQGLNT